jgi:hypothetical protein
MIRLEGLFVHRGRGRPRHIGEAFLELGGSVDVPLYTMNVDRNMMAWYALQDAMNDRFFTKHPIPAVKASGC